jgi:ATP-dependent protease ClpP protease subunit
MTVDLAKLVALSDAVQERTKTKPDPKKQKWYSIKNAADATEVYIYEDIGEWGISAAMFVDEISAIKTDKVNLHLNCKGGAVFDGVAIYNAIKNHPAHWTSIVDGVAASAASFIMLAADRVEIEKTGRVMIHDAGVGGFYAEGNPTALRESVKDLEALADLLDDLSNNIAGIYADKAGGTVAHWRSLMAKDKWYTAEEAVQVGLADGLVGGPDQENKMTPVVIAQEQPTTWDVEGLRNALKGAFA